MKILTLTFLLIWTTLLNGQNLKSDLYLKLNKEIEIKAVPAYPDEDIPFYNYLEIIKNGKILFKDTALTEYSVLDSLYPRLYQFNDHIEILLEIENRPLKNLIHKYYIKGDSLLKIEEIPTFITYPKDLDNDGKIEYAGFWYYGEVWGDTIEVTDYNPIVFYEIAENGIILDSLTTINVNTSIYGKFYGFYFNEKIEIPYIEDSEFSKEFTRIMEK